MQRVYTLGLIAIAACGAPKLSPATEGLDAFPRKITYRNVVVGYSQSQMLTIENRGTSPLDVNLAVDAPFSVDSSDFHLGAGESEHVRVTFSPINPGPSEGTLSVSTAGLGPLSVGLSATADPAPICVPSDECHAASFDPASATCIDVPIADGSACGASNQCLINATCIAGACVGQPRTCGDDNACTQDACDPNQGCVHLSATAACPQPSDACHVATCDAASGCGIAEVPDWTPCGSMSCNEAHMCFSGRCLVVSLPDGTPCGEATPCGGPPSCQSGACVAPTTPTALPVLWSYVAPAGYSVEFSSIADDKGDTFWMEIPSDGGITYVTSETRNGTLRFRAARPDLALGHPLLLADGVLVFAKPEVQSAPDRDLAGISGDDGGVLWTIDLASAFGAQPGDGFSILQAVYNGQNSVLVVSQDGDGDCDDSSAGGAWIAEINLESGSINASKRFNSPAGDNAIGTLFLGSDGQLFGRQHSRACAGTWIDGISRFDLDAGSIDWLLGDSPQAVDGDVFVDLDTSVSWTPSVRRVEDGALIANAAPIDGGPRWTWPFAISGGEVFGYIADPIPSHAWPDLLKDPTLVAFSTSTGSWIWQHRTHGWLLDGPLVTNESSVLTLSALDAGGPPHPHEFQLQLSEVLADGGQGFVCQLGTPGMLPEISGSVLRSNRLILGGRDAELVTDGGADIAAFALPGYDIADHGWVAPGANMKRNGYVP